MKELENLKDKKKGLIVHHWDTDGLASAALILNYLRQLNPQLDVNLEIPTIGNYFLTGAEIQRIKDGQYDFVVTADINFPPSTVEKIKEVCPEVLIFDHHHQEPIEGVFYYNKKYPGCSYLIDEYLGQAPTLLGVLGMVGDKEESIKEDTEFFSHIEKVIENEEITFEDMLMMRRYLDSLYIVEDYEGIETITKLLADDPKEIIRDVNLESNVQRIDQEVTHYLEADPKDLGDNIYEYQLDSEYNIISHTTRGLSRKFDDKIVVVFQPKKDIVNVYVRRTDLDVDLEKIVDFAREKNYSSGGKHEVTGIIVPRNDWEAFHEELINKLKEIQNA
ncbi:hypothetical protein KKF29_00915 [Patescibacteria group bacterium]|nr:hypothetical protein [Patescibacteria group bacterium]